MMICYYFSFFIDEIWLDWQDNILFILFSALAELNLICRIWPSPVIQGRPLEPSGLGPRFALAPRGLDISWGAPRLWAWRVGRQTRFSNPINYPPSPCVRNAWARAVTLLVSIAVSTCLLGVGLIKA